ASHCLSRRRRPGAAGPRNKPLATGRQHHGNHLWLSIEDKIPDHSAFSRARHERFRDSDAFRRVFERVVEACIAAGLVGGEGFAVDASLIVADANKQRSVPGSEWNKTRDLMGPAAP